jgi:hypothetical protein
MPTVTRNYAFHKRYINKFGIPYRKRVQHGPAPMIQPGKGKEDMSKGYPAVPPALALALALALTLTLALALAFALAQVAFLKIRDFLPPCQGVKQESPGQSHVASNCRKRMP